MPLFRDVDDALSEVVERGRTAHQLLNNALTASRTEASIRQNEDTRKISAWAALLVIPTLVSGMFGMNLGGIPLADHWIGFGLVTSVTAAAVLVPVPPLQARRLALDAFGPDIGRTCDRYPDQNGVFGCSVLGGDRDGRRGGGRLGAS